MGNVPKMLNQLNAVSSEVFQFPKLYVAADLENMHEALYRLNIIYNKETSSILLDKTGVTMLGTGDAIDNLRRILLTADKASSPKLDNFYAYIKTQEVSDALENFKVYYHDDFIRLRKEFRGVIAFYGQSADNALRSHVGMEIDDACRAIKLLGKQVNHEIEGYSPEAHAIEKFIQAHETPEGMGELAKDISRAFNKYGDGRVSKIVRRFEDLSIHKLMEPDTYPVLVLKDDALNIKLALAYYELEHS